MRNRNDEDFPYCHDYSPNELANLSVSNNSLYREILDSNRKHDEEEGIEDLSQYDY